MPISAERYQGALEPRPETPRSSFTVEQFRAALNSKELAGVLTSETDPAAVTALTALVEQAKLHGLELGDFDHAFKEISEQLDIQASSIARHEHEADRKATSLFNVPHLITLKWRGMLETFGKGFIAERAEKQRKDRLSNKDYIVQVTEAAIERASLRKRYHEYMRIAGEGGDGFSVALEQYRQGIETRQSLERNPDFTDGIDAIAAKLTVPDPFEIDGVEVPRTPENMDLIRNHLRFILQDEVIQLSQLNQMKVMETDAYRVTTKGDGKWGSMISKVLGSATLWGMGIRTGGRLAVGGSIVGASFAATPAGWGVIAAAVGFGAAAGYASQVAQYQFLRRQQKKMDLATGATRETVGVRQFDGDELVGERQVEVAKSAEGINAELKRHVDDMNRLVSGIRAGTETDYDLLRSTISETYRVMMDAECRLLGTPSLTNDAGKATEKQDLIAFGLDNRLQAGLDLVKNLKQAALAVREAKDKVLYTRHGGFSREADFEQTLQDIALDANIQVQDIKQNLEQALYKGERKRRVMGFVLGGGIAGLSAVAMDYLHDWFGNKGPSPAQPPSLENNQMVTAQQDGLEYQVKAVDDGHVMIHAVASGQEEVVALPAGVDAHEVVVSDDLSLYNAATGEPVGQIHLDLATAEVLKVPSLGMSLDVDHHALLDVQGHKFGLVVNNDGNMALYNLKPDGNVDLAQPIGHTPIQVFSEALHQKFAALAQTNGTAAAELVKAASKLHVETQPDGTVLVKSIYDQSIVAQFKVDASGIVTVPEPPVPTVGGGDLISKIFADPNSEVAQLLNKMGVQAGEIKVDAQGHFDITNEAVSGEYLGETAGWRQVRLELLLEAYKSGKLSGAEPADMVVARLERATRHLLMESGKYPDTQAAMDEAFGKGASFIANNELPWINGPKSNVADRWEDLVDAMRKLPAGTTTPGAGTVPGAGAIPGAAAGGPAAFGNIHPLTPEQLFNPTGDLSGQAVASEAVNAAWQQLAEGSANLVLGLVGGALEEKLVPSHLLGRTSAAQPEHGTRIADFTFVEEFTGGDDDEEETPPPEEPTDAEVEVDVTAEYEAAETELAEKLTQLRREMIALRDLTWPSPLLNTPAEVAVIALAEEISGLARIREADSEDAILDADVMGKNPTTLREYLSAATENANDAKAEVVQHARDRADQAERAAEVDLASLADELANTDPGLLETYRDGLTGHVGWLNVIIDNVIVVVSDPALEATLVGLRRQLKDAIEQVNTRLDELEASPVDEPEEPADPAEDLAEAARRMEEHRVAAALERLRLDTEVRLNRIDKQTRSRWMKEYVNHLDVINSIVDEMDRLGILDRAHLRQLANHLTHRPETNPRDRLVNVGVATASGHPDQYVIKTTIEKFKSHPDQSPFPEVAEPTPGSATRRLVNPDEDF